MKDRIELIEDHMQLFRDVVNEHVNDPKYDTGEEESIEIQRAFGFRSTSDWGRFCACMDLVEDTVLALQNFYRFQLEGPTRYEERGETYLRLYGVLNAVYLQQSAIEQLVSICLPQRIGDVRQDLKNHRSRELRNILGAHLVDYKKGEAFIVTRAFLKGSEVEFMSYTSDRYERVDLIQTIGDHIEFILPVVEELSIHLVETYGSINEERSHEFEQRIKILCKARQSDGYARGHNGKYIFIQYADGLKKSGETSD